MINIVDSDSLGILFYPGKNNGYLNHKPFVPEDVDGRVMVNPLQMLRHLPRSVAIDAEHHDPAGQPGRLSRNQSGAASHALMVVHLLLEPRRDPLHEDGVNPLLLRAQIEALASRRTDLREFAGAFKDPTFAGLGLPPGPEPLTPGDAYVWRDAEEFDPGWQGTPTAQQTSFERLTAKTVAGAMYLLQLQVRMRYSQEGHHRAGGRTLLSYSVWRLRDGRLAARRVGERDI